VHPELVIPAGRMRLCWSSTGDDRGRNAAFERQADQPEILDAMLAMRLEVVVAGAGLDLFDLQAGQVAGRVDVVPEEVHQLATTA
jgi:hypothetical protein